MSLLLAAGGGTTVQGTGVSVVTSLAVGALTLVAAFSGTSVVTTVSTGQATSSIALSGTSVATTAVVGQITGSGAIAGNSASTTAVVGAIGATGPLAGVSVSTSYLIGDLKQAVALTLIEGTSVSSSYSLGDLLGVLGPPVNTGGHFAGKAKKKKIEEVKQEAVGFVDVVKISRTKIPETQETRPTIEDPPVFGIVATPKLIKKATPEVVPVDLVALRRNRDDEEILLLL